MYIGRLDVACGSLGWDGLIQKNEELIMSIVCCEEVIVRCEWTCESLGGVVEERIINQVQSLQTFECCGRYEDWKVKYGVWKLQLGWLDFEDRRINYKCCVL